MKKILLLSGYDASSHRYWRKTLKDNFQDYQWTQISLPDRHFYWRVRSNSLSFALEHQDLLSNDYDLMIATSMVDLSSLRGFCPNLAQIPTLVYFHENQFAYPVSQQQANLVNVQITSIYSAICADRLIFNSHFNQSSFLEGAGKLLKRMPDHVPAGIVSNLNEKSLVLPVPINIPLDTEKSRVNHQVTEIVWNHRWEYDKQPEVFFAALKILKEKKIPFKLHLLGQSFRKKPKCFEDAIEYFTDDLVSLGYQDSHVYLDILKQADIVVSSALHDFQGLSMLQAIAHGCLPIAPKRLVYPEYIPQEYLYDGICETEATGDIEEAIVFESKSLATQLLQVIESLSNAAIKPSPIDINAYSIEQLIPLYRQLFDNSF